MEKETVSFSQKVRRIIIGFFLGKLDAENDPPNQKAKRNHHEAQAAKKSLTGTRDPAEQNAQHAAAALGIHRRYEGWR